MSGRLASGEWYSKLSTMGAGLRREDMGTGGDSGSRSSWGGKAVYAHGLGMLALSGESLQGRRGPVCALTPSSFVRGVQPQSADRSRQARARVGPIWTDVILHCHVLALVLWDVASWNIFVGANADIVSSQNTPPGKSSNRSMILSMASLSSEISSHRTPSGSPNSAASSLLPMTPT